jgi:AcrR family transcriptional regulator
MSDDEIEYAQPRGAALALIVAAERLIAAHGSDIITLRDITEAAGVANVSAINYHFGSREALLRAVFQYRVGAINARRHHYLDELAQADKLLDLRSLVGALVYPLAEELVLRPGGNYYLRFLERTTREKALTMLSWATLRKLPDLLSHLSSVLTSWGECERHLGRAIAWLPPLVVDFRMELLRVQVLSGLASIEARLELGVTLPAGLPPQLELLVDAGVAMLAGPISGEALQSLGVLNTNPTSRPTAASGRAKLEKTPSKGGGGRKFAKSP